MIYTLLTYLYLLPTPTPVGPTKERIKRVTLTKEDMSAYEFCTGKRENYTMGSE